MPTIRLSFIRPVKPRRGMIRVATFAAIVTMAFSAAPVAAQQAEKPPSGRVEPSGVEPAIPAIVETGKEETFRVLREARARLLREIPKIEAGLRELKLREERAKFLDRDIETAKRDLDLAKSARPVDQYRVASIQDFITQAQRDLKDQPKLVEGIRAREAELNSRNEALARLESQIDELLNPELARQKFKRDMSIVFAVLIGVVIAGFFVVAWQDPNVRRTIFSGQAGIQFVALFSIVIAIILFGITGILEGKELAALLGGLSGYILGRVTTATPTGGSVPPTGGAGVPQQGAGGGAHPSPGPGGAPQHGGPGTSQPTTPPADAPYPR